MSVFIVFLIFTVMVAVISWVRTKETNLSTSEGYFLGGRSLTWGLIGSSLMLTNLQATTFVGMSGQAYASNMSVMAWEVGAAIALIVVALVLVPRYLAQGLVTIPQFLEDRFDAGTRNFVTLLFMFGYIVNGLPPTLYSGALALGDLFQVRQFFHLTHEQGVWVMVVAIGVIGSLYAIIGGLRAVAVSDFVNGLGLLVGSIMVPIFGLIALGSGSFGAGIHQLLAQHPEKLNAIGGENDHIPFLTLFTGLMLVNLYYWGTDQAIIQRVLGAKDLRHAQKGIFLAGFLKILTPLVCILPGVIAFDLYGNTLPLADSAYSALAANVLPKALIGIFASVLFGAVLSNFNGVLNSSATLFALNVYRPITRGKATEKQLIIAGKVFSIVIATVAIGIAPFIQYAPQGLMQYVQIVNGFFNVPIFTVLIVGYFFRSVPPFAAKLGLAIFIVSYASMQLWFKPHLHFLHQLAILFVLCGGLMIVLGKLFPMDKPYVVEQSGKVSMFQWEYRYEASVFLVWIVLCSYIIFSRLGLASGDTTSMFQYLTVLSIAMVVLITAMARKKRVPSVALSANV